MNKTKKDYETIKKRIIKKYGFDKLTDDEIAEKIQKTDKKTITNLLTELETLREIQKKLDFEK